jgi:hypothetical protein
MGVGALFPNRPVWVLMIACLSLAWPVCAASLLSAAKANDQQRIVRLVDSGGDVNQRGKLGDTALHWMAFHGNEAMVRLLIDAGARVNAAVANGSTSLHLAAYNGHTRVASLLLQNGADANAKTRDGATPLDWARRHGHQAAVDLLAGGRDRSGRGAADTVEPGVPDRPVSAFDKPTSAGATQLYRIQLIALSSEARAAEVMARYRERHAGILQDVVLFLELVKGTEPPLYRVQSSLVPSSVAMTICDQLRRRDQPCIVRATDAR